MGDDWGCGEVEGGEGEEAVSVSGIYLAGSCVCVCGYIYMHAYIAS